MVGQRLCPRRQLVCSQHSSLVSNTQSNRKIQAFVLMRAPDVDFLPQTQRRRLLYLHKATPFTIAVIRRRISSSARRISSSRQFGVDSLLLRVSCLLLPAAFKSPSFSVSHITSKLLLSRLIWCLSCCLRGRTMVTSFCLLSLLFLISIVIKCGYETTAERRADSSKRTVSDKTWIVSPRHGK